MVPHTPPRKPRNSSRVNLMISLAFHGLIVLVGFYLAARGGLLGKELKKITVFKVEEKKPEKPKEPEKPKVEPPKQVAKVEAPKIEETKDVAPPISGPPVVAPAAAEIPSFSFEGGAAVETGSGVDVYKGLLQYAFTSKWKRPEDEEDQNFVAEVDVSVARDGRISNPQWVKKSGDKRWDDSVREALAQVSSLEAPPPTNFPSHVVIRFDVVEQTDSMIQ